MISNEKLLETYNYLKDTYIPVSKAGKSSEDVFRNMLQDEVYKQYDSSKKVSYELITDLLLGYSLARMISAKESYSTLYFEYYFSYSFMRYNSGKKEMEEKFTIFSDKLFSYGIYSFFVDYRHFADGSIRKFGTNLEVIYNVGFKLEDVEKGYCLFKRETV